MPDARYDILIKIQSRLDQLDKTVTGLQKAQKAARSLGGVLKTGIGIGIGDRLVGQLTRLPNLLFRAAQAGIRFNATLEQQQIAFETLLGSAEAAATRVAELTRFAAETPFGLEEVIRANRLLQVLTNGALAASDGMRLVGDSAAATGRSFEEAAFWIGRLHSGLQNGQPVGEATLRLIEMGLITGDLQRRLNSLAANGIIGGEAWAVAGQAFSRFSGSMEKQSKSLNGLLSTLSDTFQQLAATATEDAFGDFKASAQELISFMQRPATIQAVTGFVSAFRELALWAAQAGLVFSQFGQSLGYTFGGFSFGFADVKSAIEGAPPAPPGVPRGGGGGAGTGSSSPGSDGEEKEKPRTLRQVTFELINQRAIRQKLEDDPFVTDIAKRSDLLASLTEEIRLLTELIVLKEKEQLTAAERDDQQTRFKLLEDLEKDEIALAELNTQLKLLGGDEFQARMVEWVNSFGTAANQVADIVTNSLGTAIDGVSNGLAEAAVTGQGFGATMLNVWRQIGRQIIAATIKLLIFKALMAVVGGGGTNAGAFLTKIFTKGKAAGGFTGGGDPSEVAGVVHNREVVLEEPITRGQVRDVMAIRGLLQRGVPARDILAGRAGSAPAAAGGGLKIVLVDDRNVGARMADDSENERVILGILRRNAVELGLQF